MTTVPGLFAAGETAGGNPNKFVGGCAAEGKLAARGAIAYMRNGHAPVPPQRVCRDRGPDPGGNRPVHSHRFFAGRSSTASARAR